VLIVAPATVMHQWVAEFHRWHPEFRVAILHSSGTFAGSRRADLVAEILHAKKGVLLTSYSALVQAEEQLVSGDWHYVILDEGHKIRNPDCQASHSILLRLKMETKQERFFFFFS
jgi:DNA excision repair protein ERCC-6